MYLYVYLFLSLSLYIYIYIHTHICLSPPLSVRPNSVESLRGICLAAAPHYRTRNLSKRLPKTKQHKINNHNIR